MQFYSCFFDIELPSHSFLLFVARFQRRRLEDLPGYARNALKVKVPVATILARAKKPIKTVLELGVGSIIQFEKSYDEMLEIEVGQSIVIASAEAVKVGDKFGFRISTVALPEDRKNGFAGWESGARENASSSQILPRSSAKPRLSQRLSGDKVLENRGFLYSPFWGFSKIPVFLCKRSCPAVGTPLFSSV